MARGRLRADLPADDPDQFIHLIQRGRARLLPDMVPALLCWLSMHERIQVELRAEFAGKSNRLSDVQRKSLLDSIDATINGLRHVAQLVPQAFRRSDWRWATNQVVDRVNPIVEDDETPAETEG